MGQQAVLDAGNSHEISCVREAWACCEPGITRALLIIEKLILVQEVLQTSLDD